MDMTPEAFRAKQFLARLERTDVYTNLAWTGNIGPEDLYIVNMMKTKPGKTSEWAQLEQKMMLPIQRQRIKDGFSKGWGAWRRFYPRGTSQPNDGLTVDVVGPLAAFPKSMEASSYEAAARKVDPKIDFAAAVAQVLASRDMVLSEVYRAVTVVTRK